MGYSLRRGLFDAGFVALALGFAVAAAEFAWPKGYFLVGVLAIAGTYGFVGYRWVDQTPDPLSKENLCLTDESLLFTDWLERRHATHWDQITRIGFSRYESLFPDPFIGDYMEEYWFLVDRRDERIEIPLELAAKHDLADSLSRRFPGFDGALARQALGTEEEGQWVFWDGDLRAAS